MMNRVGIVCAIDKEKTYDLPDGNRITVGAKRPRRDGMFSATFHW